MRLPHCAKGIAWVTAYQGLRVRSRPTDGAVLGLLPKDEQVTVWAVDDGWAIVQSEGGLTGWASMEWLACGPLNP